MRGEYADRLDRGSVSGTLSSPNVTIVVDFGDAKLHFAAAVIDPQTVRGSMQTSALGNTPYPFTMVR